MPQFSDLPTKSFLGNTGAAENSYVLINYAENNNGAPVTYQATINELGKAIVNNLHLYKENGNGAVTTEVNQSEYVDGTAKQFVTAAEKTKIANAASIGAITTATDGLASIGYVSNEINGLISLGDVEQEVNDSTSQLYQNLENNFATTTYVDSAIKDISGFASAGYVNDAISNLVSVGQMASAIGAATYSLASVGYVADEIANSSTAFSPTASYEKAIYFPETGEHSTQSLYPAMVTYDTHQIYFYEPDGSQFRRFGTINGINSLAYISTSDNKPCIRNQSNNFIGFLSTT